MNMQVQYCRLLVVIIFGIFSYGCQTNTASTPEPVHKIDNSDPRAKLVIGSERLLGNVDIVNPLFRSLGKLTQAQVLVQNQTETRYTLEYKFDWEDSHGFHVNSINTWHRFTLTAGEGRTFTSTGKDPDATNIVFTVRLPDDVFIENEKQEMNQEINDTTEGEKK
jgi:uncharacterized protein YcfL